MDPHSAATTSSPRVVVVQDGARLHYAVPVALQRQGALERMYTPWYVKGVAARTLAAAVQSYDPVRGKRFAERQHPELDPQRIFTHPRLAFRHASARKRFSSDEAFYAWESDDTGAWIARQGFGSANALFGFVRNVSPALLSKAKDAGLVVVADQMIAAAFEENRQQRLQAERFPQWSAGAAGPTPAGAAGPTRDGAAGAAPGDAALQAIEAATWAGAHAVTCASDYVKGSLVERGIAADRIHVLPYPIDPARYEFIDRSQRSGPVLVGFVGLLGLRKGAPYLLAVAERLRSANVRFVLVGSGPRDKSLLAGHPNIDFVGHVPRSEVAAHLARFDLLLFPSTCEGSPGAVMEAMATGLPIVSTPNSGTVVRHGIEGFIHPYDDIDALTDAVACLTSNETLRLEMGRAARARAASFTLDDYGRRLVALYGSLLESGQPK